MTVGHVSPPPDVRDARRAANRRASDRARSDGQVQRSVLMPAECWRRLRDVRALGETSDAQTIARLIRDSRDPRSHV